MNKFAKQLLWIFCFFLMGFSWNVDHCKKVDLFSLTDVNKNASFVGKRVYVDGKYQNFLDDRIVIWKAHLNFYLAPRAPHKKQLITRVGKFKIYDNIRMFGILKYEEENQNFTFYIYYVLKYKNDLDLFREKISDFKKENKPLADFYRLAGTVLAVAELHSFMVKDKVTKKKKKIYSALGENLFKLRLEILNYAIQKREQQVKPKDFPGHFKIYQDYVKLGRDYLPQALKKILYCYSLQPDSQKTIEILQKNFGRLRYLKNGKIRWVTPLFYYQARGYRQHKQQWYSPDWYSLMKKIAYRLPRIQYSYSTGTSVQRKFQQEAKKNGKIQERYGRQAVLLAWGYPSRVFRYQTKRGYIFELWKYGKTKWVFLEQKTKKERFARVINFFPKQPKHK